MWFLIGERTDWDLFLVHQSSTKMPGLIVLCHVRVIRYLNEHPPNVVMTSFLSGFVEAGGGGWGVLRCLVSTGLSP